MGRMALPIVQVVREGLHNGPPVAGRQDARLRARARQWRQQLELGHRRRLAGAGSTAEESRDDITSASAGCV